MPRKENTFLLVSLEENKAKKLAQVINNDACRRILDCLAKKEATETELSKELNLPISTVHYNLKHLLESGLIKSEEFHYSSKGKEVSHYALANKYIIIAPKVTESLAHKLKRILPVALLIGAASGIIQLFRQPAIGTFAAPLKAPAEAAGARVLEEAGKTAADAAVTGTAGAGAADVAAGLTEAAAEGLREAANTSAAKAADAGLAQIPQLPQVPAAEPSIALWFFLGAMSALVIYFIYDLLKERWSK